MATFFNNIQNRFKQGDMLVKLIFINVFVFLVLNILNIFFKLFQMDSIDFIEYLAVPSLPSDLLIKPWTLFSYMFVHLGIWHILFNMLVFYWFGQLFLNYFNERQLLGLYIIGGLAGALIYILAFNFIPYYANIQSVLIGASAAVMAIVFGVAFYRPELRINLLFIGNIKIIYFALAMFVIDFISLDDMSNPGGHIAHIGGALAGYLFATQMKKGKDITGWINKIFDSIVNLNLASSQKQKKQKNPKMKVTFTRKETDYEYNARKHKQEEDIDEILDKIKQSGYDSLSGDEKKKLFDASKK